MPKQATIRPETIEQATVRLIKDDRQWPCWPVLPLKNRRLPNKDPFGTLGFLCAPLVIDKTNQPSGLLVYIGMIPQYTGKSPVDYPTMHYPDLSEFLAAGWVMD